MSEHLKTPGGASTAAPGVLPLKAYSKVAQGTSKSPGATAPASVAVETKTETAPNIETKNENNPEISATAPDTTTPVAPPA